MAQVKIYGRRSVWNGRQLEISDVVHEALRSAWQLPQEKRFHRFLLLDDDDVVVPQRSEAYLVVEIVCFPGRSDVAKRKLIRGFYAQVAPALRLDSDDLEIVILESPKENWGIRGVSADELNLPYDVEI